mmetsp:Transcript_9270/g.14852  ORF Transcript_9270/g.14852 Transcript_9270/m.14852 type:complete len:99 (-) Transcript_9270:46-342(-)
MEEEKEDDEEAPLPPPPQETEEEKEEEEEGEGKEEDEEEAQDLADATLSPQEDAAEKKQREQRMKRVNWMLEIDGNTPLTGWRVKGVRITENGLENVM